MRCQNFLITILNQGYKVASLTLETGSFLEKIKTSGCIPDNNAILVTADVVGSYPSIPHQAGLIALKEALYKRLSRNKPTTDLIKMGEFVFSNNFLNLIVTHSNKYQGWL